MFRVSIYIEMMDEYPTNPDRAEKTVEVSSTAFILDKEHMEESWPAEMMANLMKAAAAQDPR